MRRFFCRVAAAPYPAYSPKSLLALALGPLKLPVLAATGRPLCAPCATENRMK
ncbi:hypothetical protein [Klebsiella quasipneumoniae]|uniref:hypothetical protein n=1 Tax=Klebsiella quasipneumoniae TaxID=1463165 RepID=UPI001909BA8F|nr:hypothetical protein [Klebsiella quasipneumoniae]HBS3682300.1 hypothetical protein [Klebsiella quasipneumoniae subsp. similipneumoniae]MCH2029437.1 hypothetical protein [Klebsiella quasipneumoniae]MCQ3864235.1 hypothetical protein [Klebsiella quasipneumoniae]MCZ9505663.1 hypothetical protein [Klebsiella quasipneumoniae]MDX6812812.1 hypothetical protein [Klebsiella quasipneumoniae]